MWTSGQVDTNDGAIAYRFMDIGEPWLKRRSFPIVFQHGLGLTADVWLPWFKSLAASHPIVTIDLRGHGGSARAWTKQDYSLDDITKDITVVLDHLGIQVCHFIGESFGGTLGLHLAAQQPRRLASVVACSTGIYGQWLTNIEGWPDFVAREGVVAWSREFMQGRFVSGSVDPALVEWVDKSQRTLAPQVVAGIVHCLQKTDLRQELRGLATPLLIISPGGSPYVDLRSAHALQELVPLAEAVFFPDARHGVVMSHWSACSEAAAQFLARVEARRGVC